MIKFALRKWLGSDALFDRLVAQVKAIEERIIHLPKPIEPPVYKQVQEQHHLDVFKESIKDYNVFTQQMSDTEQKIQQIEQDILQIEPELETSGYFSQLAHGQDLNSLKEYLNNLTQVIAAKKAQYEKAKKDWLSRMNSLRIQAASQVLDVAYKADLSKLKTDAELIERDLDLQINYLTPKGLVSLTRTKMKLSEIKSRLSRNIQNHKPVYQMLIESWKNLPFKNPKLEGNMDYYCRSVTETQDIIQRVIEKLDKYVEKLTVLQARFKEEFEEAKWVRNYPELYFLHGVKTKGGEFWGHNMRTKFSNSLDALEYNIREKPELAYSRSRDPLTHWFVVGLRAIDGEITVADTSTKALESGERISTSEKETFIEDPITKEVVLVKYDFGGQGKDITKKNIINYPNLDYVSGQNEVSIKNPVFDGIWIDFIEILIEQGVNRFTPSEYGLNSKEQLIKGCQTLAKKYNLKLYAIQFDKMEEVNPDDNARIKEIMAETRKKLNAKGIY